jgi:outer membrane protein
MLNKAVKSAAVVLLGSLMLMGNATAKDQKIGIVDVQAVGSQLPQMAAIQQTVAAEFKNQVEELKKLQADAKYNYDKLQREGDTMSDAQKEELRKTIMDQQKVLEEKGKPLQQAMQRRGAEEQNKIYGLVQQAIEAIAKDGNYDVILHKTAAAYVADGDKADISAKVIERVKKL